MSYLVMQMFDVFLNGINQLRLVLLDSTSDLDKV